MNRNTTTALLFTAAAAVYTAPATYERSATTTTTEPECCQQSLGCLPWNPIFGSCAAPCVCPVPTPTPTPERTGRFDPMPMVNHGAVVANYVQGPAAVRLPEGIAVFMDWGRCCLAPDDENGGEKIGYLFLRWGAGFYYSEPWIDTRLMLNIDGLGRPAHEAAFPSVILAAPYEWWVAYSSTQYPNPDHVIEIGVIKSAMPYGPPYDVKHRSMFVSERRAWSPTLVRINGKMWLYSNDYYRPPEHTTIRQWVQSSQTIGPGEPINTPMLTDVAQAADGTIYALSGQNPEHGIALYRSADGRAFTKVRDYERLGEQVFDGGFLRWPDSRLVEPMVVFGNSIPQGSDQFSRWRLVWWADAGAALPRALTGFDPRPIRSPKL